MISRILHAFLSIEDVLPSKDEYVVTTSEFDFIKAQLGMLGKQNPDDSHDKPSLRGRTNRGTGSDKAEEQSEPAEDDRPTL
jgi:beta-barrel assembly-enhancing protease